MSKILVTGAAGFIGSSLTKALLKEGTTVVGIDNLSTGKMSNLEGVLPRIDFRHADITDASAIENACFGVDCVFHEAAIPSVPLSVEDPVGTDDVNLRGTLNVLEAARRNSTKRVVFASSSAIYGSSPELPKTEAMLPAPVSPYAVQKLASEHYLGSYAQIFGVETIALRYFNIFGPHQDPSSQYSGVLAIFISRMLEGKTPTIFGDGSTSRDFTFIDNVVQANLLAARAPANCTGRAYNVGTGTRTTLNEAYQAIADILGFEEEPIYKPERTGDIRHSGADITRISQELGYKPSGTLRDGLEATVNWARLASAMV